MCGIAGFINHPGNNLQEKEFLLNRMLTRIQHRGPDETGLFLTNQACFGNVRLSIIDLAGGQQPLCNADGRLWIAYNGEVFNYLELREELLSLGHTFKTHSDTEVVLHLYEEYGEKGLTKLNGQFAFAVYDTHKKELFLARDRVGIRPLYYYHRNKEFVFGSEIKAVLEYPGVERNISFKALKQVFTFWTTLTPDTVFEGIHEVPPGHYLKLRDNNVELKSYWELCFAPERPRFSGTINDATEAFRELFTDAIQLRLRADVPVAAYLSGGLDSSITTSFINQVEPSVLNTFSIGFADPTFDETPYQKEVAAYFNTRHQSVTCVDNDIADLLPKVIWHSEIPLMRTSPVPMMKLSELVRSNGIKVVITGEGADEALGGYNIFKETLIRQFWSRQPQSKLRPLLLKKLYPYMPQLANASPAMLRLFFGYNLEETMSPIYSHMLRWKNNSHITNHFSGELKQATHFLDPIDTYQQLISSKVSTYSPLAKAQFIETNVFMSGYLLSSQGDRMAMGNSVEGRYPFLDHRILEFCASLPDDFKLNGLNEKYLLKRMMKGKLPQPVLNRPKQAYRAPVASALLRSKNGIVKENLSHQALNETGLFNSDSVQKIIQKIENGATPSEVDNMTVVGVLSTQLLVDQFINGFSYLDEKSIHRGVVRNKI
jgi:asparagine synthase (glutamine-hydrolysing)